MAVATIHEKKTVEQRRQQLYDRLCRLMDKQQPYTDERLNRHELAAMLSTNHRYVEEAIRACSDHPSTSSFINAYRISHAARLLVTTNHSVTLIAALSGFSTRAYFYKQFRQHFQTTPMEYRQETSLANASQLHRQR